MQLQIRDEVLDLSSPKVMGVLNATPDSFSDGGEFNTLDSALKQIKRMVNEGADIIDVGGESTRPGSDPVSKKQELERVIPILKKAIPKHPDILFSIDTTRFSVAKEALELGTHFINDVSGLQREPKLAGLAADYGAGYILMHSLWPPKTMQQDPQYEDVTEAILSFFKRQVNKAEQEGLNNLILDPGFGFGKTVQHNAKIINNLQAFKEMGFPLMVGASRKSTIGKILNDRPVDDRVTGTVAVHYHALMRGANIIRVHDVKEAKDSVLVFEALREE